MDAIYQLDNLSPIVYEIWKPITERSVPDVTPGMYYISNLGRVWSTYKNDFMKPHLNEQGYLKVWIGTRKYFVHRLVMIEFHYIENYQEYQVNHMYGDKLDNVDYCLEWCTNEENMRHAVITGLTLHRFGEDNPHAIISNEQAEQICSLLSERKYTIAEIAGIVGTTRNVVSNISSGKTHKQISDKYNIESVKGQKPGDFSNAEVHDICKYFEEHSHEFKRHTDLFRQMMIDVFNKQYEPHMKSNLNRILNHKTRRDISDQYNF